MSAIANDLGSAWHAASLSAVLNRSANSGATRDRRNGGASMGGSIRRAPCRGSRIGLRCFLLAALAGEFSIGVSRSANRGFGGLDGGLLAGALFVLLAQLAGLYRLPTLLAPGASLPRLALTVALAQLAVVSVLFLLKSGADHSRGATIAFAVLALTLTPLGRVALARTARWRSGAASSKAAGS